MFYMETEKIVGRRVATARTTAGFSQKQLAEAMRARGFTWSQATVWALERGDRNLRYVEAQALNEEVGFPLDPASPPDEELHQLRTFRRSVEALLAPAAHRA